MTGFLALSAVLITGLANANITTDRKNKLMMLKQKLNNNDNAAISLDELTARQNCHFSLMDRDQNG